MRLNPVKSRRKTRNRSTRKRKKWERIRKEDMRRSALRSLMMLVTILLLPLLVLVAQETSSPPIDRQVGELGGIYVQAQEQSKSPSVQPFSLRSGVTIRLSGDWGPDLYDRTPTPSVLYRYAPR